MDDSVGPHMVQLSIKLIPSHDIVSFIHSHTLGIMIGHVTPEAFDGGPIALVKDGDIITVDAPHRTLSVVSFSPVFCRYQHSTMVTSCDITGHC